MVILASVKNPVTREQICNFANIDSLGSEVEDALQYPSVTKTQNEEEDCFLIEGEQARQGLFEELQVDPRPGHTQIANYYSRLVGMKQVS